MNSKKYWIIFKNGINLQLINRLDFFTGFIAEAFSLLIMIYLWLSVYRQGSQIGSYSLKALIVYYVISKLIGLIVKTGNLPKKINMIIKMGELNNYLVKPVNLMFNMFFFNISESIVRLAALLIITSPWYPYLFSNILLIDFTIFAFFLLISISINFLIFYMIGILTFFLDEIIGLASLFSVIAAFLSGLIIPLDIMPAQLKIIVGILPFQYIVFVPIKILTGDITAHTLNSAILGGMIWVLILYLLAIYTYKSGLKKYEAFGG